MEIGSHDFIYRTMNSTGEREYVIKRVYYKDMIKQLIQKMSGQPCKRVTGWLSSIYNVHSMYTTFEGVLRRRFIINTRRTRQLKGEMCVCTLTSRGYCTRERKRGGTEEKEASVLKVLRIVADF